MARIQVTVKSDSMSAQFVGADGTTVREVEPMEIFSVGNSIGGYIAAPMDSRGSRWGLWRIGGADKALLNELQGDEEEFYAFASELKRGQPERVVVDGRQYLLATSSGSARRGVVHTYRPPQQETDPVKRVLRELGMGLSVLEVIGDEPIAATVRWYDQQHCPNGRATHHWVTDGEETEMFRRMLEEPHGYFGGGGLNEIVITGGTYAIRVDYHRHLNGCGSYTVTKVMVRPGCNAARLKEALVAI